MIGCFAGPGFEALSRLVEASNAQWHSCHGRRASIHPAPHGCPSVAPPPPAPADGGWEPKPVDSAALASLKRRGSGRSRGSAGGATRSRGTKHSTGAAWCNAPGLPVGAGCSRAQAALLQALRGLAAGLAPCAACCAEAAPPNPQLHLLPSVRLQADTHSSPAPIVAEEGTESELRKHRAAAADTAASPKPRGGRRPAPAKRQRGAGEASSSGSSEAEGEGSGDERASARAAAAAGSAERQQRGAANAGDPLECWFKQHYSLLKAAGLMGMGYAPASAETGRPAAARRRRPGGASPGKAGGAARRASGGGKAAAEKEEQEERKRRREARRAERQAAKAAEVRPVLLPANAAPSLGRLGSCAASSPWGLHTLNPCVSLLALHCRPRDRRMRAPPPPRPKTAPPTAAAARAGAS